MALEAMVFPQDPFGYTSAVEFCTTNSVGGSSIQILEEIAETSNSHSGNWDSPHPSPLDSSMPHQQFHNSVDFPRHKRRRAKSRRNREETENQRMTHIAVERNRRKQMNDYLSVLRSLMPVSYVPRGDQASIIGGAINYVKELEQRFQFLSSHTKNESLNESLHFSEFLNFPQYSTAVPLQNQRPLLGIADIEVGMVESHVSIKIRTCKRRRQILMLVSGLQTLNLTVLHLNVTTKDRISLYSLSAKVEDDCISSSLDEIASAVHQLLCKIQEDDI